MLRNEILQENGSNARPILSLAMFIVLIMLLVIVVIQQIRIVREQVRNALVYESVTAFARIVENGKTSGQPTNVIIGAVEH
jgi:hypothetical protein